MMHEAVNKPFGMLLESTTRWVENNSQKNIFTMKYWNIVGFDLVITCGEQMVFIPLVYDLFPLGRLLLLRCNKVIEKYEY